MIVPGLTVAAGHVSDQNNQGIPSDTYEKFFVCPQISVACVDHDEKTLALVKDMSKKSACIVQLVSNDRERVFDILDGGATHVVLEKGSPLLGDLPKDRVSVSLECEINQATLTEIAGEINGLKNHASNFLLKCRGGSQETPEDLPVVIKELTNLIGKDVKLATAGDIAWSYKLISDLHSIGVNVHVSSSLLSTSLDLGEAIVACLKSDRPDGLFSTIVADEHNTALGLVFSSKESVIEAIKTKKGVYHSRHRGLWRKGESSGNVQELLKISMDCDSDALRFTVHQEGEGFCHLNTWTCFGQSGGLPSLMRTLEARKQSAPPGSYTDRLYKDSKLLHAKIMEEASELCEATVKEEIAWEAADVMYFALVKCAKAGVSLADVEAALDQRALKVWRRPGNAKPKWAEAIENKTPTETKPSEVHTPTSNGTTAESSCLACHDFKSLNLKQLQELCKRPATLDSPKLESLVKPIIDNVKQNGDKALLELTEKFDKVTLNSPVLQVESLQAPVLDENVKAAIDLAYDNIYKFHEAQLNPKPLDVETCTGVKCSRHVRPIEKVGLYVPGGSAVLPSTALMLGIPAKVVGCHDIIIATPPTKEGTVCPEILYIAKKVGASKILLAGGAQAVAAMAYGTDSVPKVDKICGPGNQFVTMAKMLVQNDNNAIVSIDMPAGPSEVMVVADETAVPSFVAADLLSQAEHGPESQVVLVAISLSDQQLTAIQNELERQMKKLPRWQIAQAALSKSFILKVSNMAEALQFSNMYAPEHLIINAKNAESCLPSIHNAGSVFLGPYSSESCGDYASGTNHTLPTYGYARMYSGVSTATFQKHITAQCVTKEGLSNIGPAVAILAAVENLDAHRNAILIRQEYIERNGGQ